MGVSLAEILMTIKNISAREGKAPQDAIESVDSLMADGCLSPISGRSEKQRENLGLPQLPKADPAEIQKMVEVTGVIDLLEANRKAVKEASG